MTQLWVEHLGTWEIAAKYRKINRFVDPDKEIQPSLSPKF